jgi:hypothetical protein
MDKKEGESRPKKWGILKYLSAEISPEMTRKDDWSKRRKKRTWSKNGVWQHPSMIQGGDRIFKLCKTGFVLWNYHILGWFKSLIVMT